ncbi:hypothetical protein AC249_AIPGENE5634 [Exaiptasia diaphana]|nr:hypothetical protein AC249_AIPGENE5634 [Exaiptasia diaphana]
MIVRFYHMCTLPGRSSGYGPGINPDYREKKAQPYLNNGHLRACFIGYIGGVRLRLKSDKTFTQTEN